MLERVHIKLSWPRLVGIASGVFGGSLVVSSVAESWEASSFRAHGSAGLVVLLYGCLFLFLTFPLYAARAWARRAFLLVTFSLLVVISISFSLMVVHQAWSPSVPHPTLRLLTGLCALVAALTPPSVVFIVFLRPDVKGAFQTQDASNHPIERTADRGTLHS
jgi:hypothetical protein